MHINSLLDLDYKDFSPVIKYILSMNITQDDGDNEHSLSPERIVSRLHIAATLTNLIAV